MSGLEAPLREIEAATSSIRDLYRAQTVANVALQDRVIVLEDALRDAMDEISALRGNSPVVPAAPAAPSDLRCRVDGAAVECTWQDNSSDETAFIIETRDTEGSGAWAIAKTSGVNATSQRVTMPNRDWRYDFRVRAIGATVRDADGNAVELSSEPSNVVQNLFVRGVETPLPELPSQDAIVVKDAALVDAAISQAKRESRPLVIEGLTFRGKMLRLEGMERVTVRNCIFQNIPGGWFSGHGILIMQGLKNSLIVNNLFVNIGDADIAGGYGNSQGLVIRRNRHQDTKEGIHLVGGGPLTDVAIEDETFTGLTRMAIELQNGGKRYAVRRCRGSGWRSATDRDRFFVSMAAVETEETIVEDCECVAPADAPRGDPMNRMGINYEIAGRNAVCRRCTSTGAFVGPTALSGHSDPIKSRVLFDQVKVHGFNEPWGKPWHGSIYLDATPAENVTVKDCTFEPAR